MGRNKRQQSEPETLITFPILVQLINSKTLLANQDDSFGISASGLARVKMTGNFRPFETGFGTDDKLPWHSNIQYFRKETHENIM